MNKEYTPLEALKELRYRITNFNGKFHNYNELMGTIETALKQKENMEKTIDELFSDNGKVITTIEIKNKLKALDIIKRELNIDEILFSLKGVASVKDYDLVKEVLL